MGNLIFIAACFLGGFFLRRTGRFPENFPASLNAFIIHFSLPALTLVYIHQIEFSWELFFPLSMAWIFFAFGFLFFNFAGRLLNLPSRTVGCLILTCALGNTSFVGLPMIEAFYGQAYLGTGLIVDQAGTFVVLSTLGILTATRYASGRVPFTVILKRIFTFPPFYAVILAVGTRPLLYPDWLNLIIERFGQTLIPLALISVGFQIRFSSVRQYAKKLVTGLVFKLVIGPAFILALFVFVMKGYGPLVRVTIFEAAMPPIIMGSIIAIEYKLDPHLASLLLGVGIPLSFLTLTGWWWMLSTAF